MRKPFTPGSFHRDLAAKRAAKALDMAERYEAGSTLHEIGNYYGITRERVRQLIKGELGMTGRDGGAAVRGREKANARAKQLNLSCLRRHGITRSEQISIREQFGYRPFRQFQQQRRNSRDRGIPWQLTFGEWWEIWQKSGKWPERGRGASGYVMARHGDKGAYAVGNVKIIHATQNQSEYIRRYWSEVRSGKRPQPKAAKGQHRSALYLIEPGQTIAVPITQKRPEYARNHAWAISKSRGWKIRTSTRGDVLTVTRIQ